MQLELANDKRQQHGTCITCVTVHATHCASAYTDPSLLLRTRLSVQDSRKVLSPGGLALQGILFDVDGTLVESTELAYSATNEV